MEDHSLKISFENDFLNFRGDGTDRYFTNGLRIDYFVKKQKINFPSSLLFKISTDKNLYSWGVAQYMFTPSRIDVADIQYNDRPYAGALVAIHSLSSFDYTNRLKLSSQLFLGVMGPMSLAKETQIFVHSTFNYPRPKGWDNQVPNDIIINYNIQLEKELIYIPGKLLISGNIETFNGTLYNAMGAGFMMKAGKISNYYRESNADNIKKKNATHLYVFMSPAARVIYSNALLEGGIITNINQVHKGYILNKDQIERLNVFADVGVIYERPKFGLAIIQKMRTSDFKGGNAMEVGSISLNFKL
jgi:lipid A 3-O-deacylase